MMQAKAILLSIIVLLGSRGVVQAAPAANALDENSIEKRGYGCNAVFPDEPGICNFHVRVLMALLRYKPL
jgi:hypothetical protein